MSAEILSLRRAEKGRALPSEKIGLKLFASSSPFPHGASFMEVFHDWIRRKELPELMIDVADYAHVERGTHVYFCGHESDYVIDTSGGRPGLLYRRKRAPASPNALADGLARVLRVAGALEREPKLAGLRFSKRELWIGLYDRLGAPNTDATLAALEDAARAPVEAALGQEVRFERAPSGTLELASVRAFA